MRYMFTSLVSLVLCRLVVEIERASLANIVLSVVHFLPPFHLAEVVVWGEHDHLMFGSRHNEAVTGSVVAGMLGCQFVPDTGTSHP